jgi:hypothetical protein
MPSEAASQHRRRIIVDELPLSLRERLHLLLLRLRYPRGAWFSGSWF